MAKCNCHSDESQNLTVERKSLEVGEFLKHRVGTENHVSQAQLIFQSVQDDSNVCRHSEALAEESLTKVAKDSSLVALTQNDGVIRHCEEIRIYPRSNPAFSLNIILQSLRLFDCCILNRLDSFGLSPSE